MIMISKEGDEGLGTRLYLALFNVPESETKSCKISQSVPHSLGLGLACVIMGITSYLATNYYHHCMCYVCGKQPKPF